LDILIDKLDKAITQTGVTTVAIGGGVSANSGVRQAVADLCESRGITAFIPPREFTTDNAAMVAIAGMFKFISRDFCPYDAAPFARTLV
ncbi:MAG: tRNA (adenosine(37)-N6)-threonylcarbamoyltransferase complex transferase subunit TsaD, partial [Muribaculaceae bacterium]|nr:tRNA (adenosine(37)-N6)-threonylcarbamoyltransferase complex transferase subunit TsaD [Muribaculaceae bacterium]